MTLTKATLTNISTNPPGDPIMVQFNPESYVQTVTTSYADLPVPGLQRSLTQFVSGGKETLELTLFLDGTGERPWTFPTSVQKNLEAIRTFVTIAPELHAPPVCEFHWQDLTFAGVITTLVEEVTLFDEDGHALRAKVTVTFKAYQAVEEQVRSMRLASPDRTRVRVLREGETLAHVALEVYGSERLWSVIARANQIDRPRFVRPGTPLYIPAL
jgi:Contractile injection system tube protein